MPKTLAIAWSREVTETESNLVLDSVDRMLKRLYFHYWEAIELKPIDVKAYGYWAIPALVPDKPYWGIQWYINQSYDEGLEQVIAPRYLELVDKEPWQKANPHYDLVVLDQDLSELPAPVARLRPGSYALGTSYPGKVALISVHRIRRITEMSMREMLLKRLVLHHMGHLLGAPSYARQDHTVRRGMEEHCPNICVMRHAETLEQLQSFCIQELWLKWPFCGSCTQDMMATIIRHSRVWN